MISECLWCIQFGVLIEALYPVYYCVCCTQRMRTKFPNSIRYSGGGVLLIYGMCTVMETAVLQERVDSRQKSFTPGNYNECASTCCKTDTF